jgi:DNA polymerase-3 subunit alpha
VSSIFLRSRSIAKLIPSTLNISLDQAVEQEPQLKEMIKEIRKWRPFGIARSLEGLTRHALRMRRGGHVKQILMEYLPFIAEAGKMTQYAMKEVESIGLVKFDFLGLKP